MPRKLEKSFGEVRIEISDSMGFLNSPQAAPVATSCMEICGRLAEKPRGTSLASPVDVESQRSS